MASNAEIAAAARALGHDDLRIERTASGRRYAISCSCGYGAPRADGTPTTTRATFQVAVADLQEHLRRSVRRHEYAGRVSGASLARTV